MTSQIQLSPMIAPIKKIAHSILPDKQGLVKFDLKSKQLQS